MRESVIYQSILKEGRKEGLKQGQEEAIQRIVTNMLDKGVSVELIVEFAGLTLESVQQLQA